MGTNIYKDIDFSESSLLLEGNGARILSRNTNFHWDLYVAGYWSIHNMATQTPFFRLQASTGNVLINKSIDAGFKLDVNGTTSFNGSSTFGTLGSGTGMFWNNTNNRLGIGTNNPLGKLHIQDGVVNNLVTWSGSDRAILSNNGSCILQMQGPNNSDLGIGFSGIGVRSLGGVSYNTASHSLSFATSDGSNPGTVKLIVAGNGNVLIGTTTNTTYKLNVNGTAKVSRLNISNIPTSNSGLVTGDIWSDSGVLKIV